jgi:ParB family chromosome partitioning protein
VVIKANVRTDVNLTREFVAIKRHGVIVPVIGHPGEDGRVTVEEGQRRILAAIEAERFEVPAYIVPESDTEAIRIIRQLIANDQRAELTEGERAAAWKQLELDGLSVTAIARELSEKPKRVKAGLAVVDSEVATNAVTEHQLTLDQALVLIESRTTRNS